MKHIARQFEIRWEEPEDFTLEAPKEVDADNDNSESQEVKALNQEPTLFE